MRFDGPYVIQRSMQDPTKQLPCWRCTDTRGVKTSVHRERRRVDQNGDLFETFVECDHCGTRTPGGL